MATLKWMIVFFSSSNRFYYVTQQIRLKQLPRIACIWHEARFICLVINVAFLIKQKHNAKQKKSEKVPKGEIK
jgi:hypothetical protein